MKVTMRNYQPAACTKSREHGQQKALKIKQRIKRRQPWALIARLRIKRKPS